MGLFDRYTKKNEKPIVHQDPVLKAPLKPLAYPPKILLAWGEAISGNKEIREWLLKNDYEELGIFVYALNNVSDARRWLMVNGYAHLLAMLTAAEGDQVAIDWLKKHRLEALMHMAAFIDGEKNSIVWLTQYDPLYAGLARKMRVIKLQIENNNDDPHRMSF